MSVPPSFMQQLMAGLQSGMQNPLLMNGLGIMSAAGPSKMPVSLGGALAGGMQQGQQLQQGQLANAMQQLMLGQNIQGLQAMSQAGKGPAPIPAAFQAFAPDQTSIPTQGVQPSTQSAQTPPVQAQLPTGLAPALLNGAASQNPPQAAPSMPSQQAAQSQAPWAPLRQIAEDTQRLKILESMPNNDKFTKAAADLREQMGAQYFNLPPEMVQQFTGAPPLKGYGYQINELGQVKPYGESIYATGMAPGPNGVPQTFIANKSTGGVSFPGANASQRTPGTPLSPADESYAQGLAEYKYKPPSVGSRNSVQALKWLARAQEINPSFDENAYDAKHAAYLSMAAGKDYNTNSAYSTIQTHFQTLQQAMDALNNGDIQSANKLVNWSGAKFGQSAPTNAKMVNDIVMGELAKVLAQGGQVTESVRGEARDALAPYFSKGQTAGGIQYASQLIAGKMATSHLNAKANNIPDDVWLAHISPEARQALQAFEASHQGQQPAGGAVGTYNPATGKVEWHNQ